MASNTALSHLGLLIGIESILRRWKTLSEGFNPQTWEKVQTPRHGMGKLFGSEDIFLSLANRLILSLIFIYKHGLFFDDLLIPFVKFNDLWVKGCISNTEFNQVIKKNSLQIS